MSGDRSSNNDLFLDSPKVTASATERGVIEPGIPDVVLLSPWLAEEMRSVLPLAKPTLFRDLEYLFPPLPQSRKQICHGVSHLILLSDASSLRQSRGSLTISPLAPG